MSICASGFATMCFTRGAIVGKKGRSGADGEGITLTVTKAESYV